MKTSATEYADVGGVKKTKLGRGVKRQHFISVPALLPTVERASRQMNCFK